MQAASSGLEELLSREGDEWARYRSSSVGAGSEKWMRYLEYMHGPFHQMVKQGWSSSQQKSKAETDSLQHQLASASSRAASAETRASQVRHCNNPCGHSCWHGPISAKFRILSQGPLCGGNSASCRLQLHDKSSENEVVHACISAQCQKHPCTVCWMAGCEFYNFHHGGQASLS